MTFVQYLVKLSLDKWKTTSEQFPFSTSYGEVISLFGVNIILTIICVVFNSAKFCGFLVFWWSFWFTVATSIFLLIYFFSQRKPGPWVKAFTSFEGLLPAFLFYLTYLLFPSVVSMDMSWRLLNLLVSFTRRLGLANTSILADVGIAGLVGFFTFLIFAPAFSILQRAKHIWIILTFFAFFSAIMFVLGSFVLFPFSDSRPRRVDVIHFWEVPSESNSVGNSQLALGTSFGVVQFLNF